MLQKNEKLDIVIPVYNEESCIEELIRRLTYLRKQMGFLEVNFVFVNDGSSDKSLDILQHHAEQCNFIKVINFSRNFGHQMAVSAGIDHSNADYIVIIDADLQDPPELIEEMYEKAKEGFDVVYGKRLTREKETYFKKISAKLFYKLISKLCDVQIPTDTGDFRLINKKVAESLKKMKEQHRFIRGMVPWVGFKSTPLYYHRQKRLAGETKYPLRKMIKFALDAIFSFSNKPLKVAIYFGTFIILFGLFLALFMLYIKFFTTIAVPGITVVLLTIIIMSGFQIFMLGIIGEYIGRIFEESKGRPLYIVESTVNFSSVELGIKSDERR